MYGALNAFVYNISSPDKLTSELYVIVTVVEPPTNLAVTALAPVLGSSSAEAVALDAAVVADVVFVPAAKAVLVPALPSV